MLEMRDYDMEAIEKLSIPHYELWCMIYTWVQQMFRAEIDYWIGVG